MFEVTLHATDDDAHYLLGILHRRKPRIVFYKAVIDRITTITGDLTMLILTDSQEVDLAIKPLTRKGHPAQVDGVPAWAVSDATIATIVAAADGLSCVIQPAANLGSVQVSVSADADLGDGIETITGTLDIEVVAGKAVTLGIIAGTPREQV